MGILKKDYNVIIIGAGVVGLAIARSLSDRGVGSVLVIEKEKTFGRGISSRNSEVIHSGLYYPQQSLKTKHCIRGRQLLYEFCKKHNIWHRMCGKIIIGKIGQEEDIHSLYNKALNNSIPDVSLLSNSQISSIEQHISAELGLYVGCSGIISSHHLMEAFFTISNNHDHDYLFKTSVVDIDILNSGYKLLLNNPNGELETVTSNWVINASGLASDIVADFIGNAYTFPEITFSKGCYFKLSSEWKGKFKHLVYPIPDKLSDSLGIHLSFNSDEQIKIGPNAIWLNDKEEDYNVDSHLLDDFYDQCSTYIKGLKKSHLSPDYSGIRPKIRSANSKFSDFHISDEQIHGLPGFINLIGIDSPGLTSAISIGKDISKVIT